MNSKQQLLRSDRQAAEVSSAPLRAAAPDSRGRMVKAGRAAAAGCGCAQLGSALSAGLFSQRKEASVRVKRPAESVYPGGAERSLTEPHMA